MQDKAGQLLRQLSDEQKKSHSEIAAQFRKSRNTYEILTWLLGFFGLNRIYLGQKYTALARTMLVFAAALTAFTGFWFATLIWLQVAFALFSISLAVWFFDLATSFWQLRRYHEQIDLVIAGHIQERS